MVAGQKDRRPLLVYLPFELLHGLGSLNVSLSFHYLTLLLLIFLLTHQFLGHFLIGISLHRLKPVLIFLEPSNTSHFKGFTQANDILIQGAQGVTHLLGVIMIEGLQTLHFLNSGDVTSLVPWRILVTTPNMNI